MSTRQSLPKLTFHWQLLAPLAVMFCSFTAMPLIVTKIYNYRYNNKYPRCAISTFDKYMVNRDQYIMGDFTVQKAPYGETI